MSADNGIYILKTPKGEGFEYRVAHLQAVENYEWGRCPIHGADLRRKECSQCTANCNRSDSPEDHIANAREMWASCTVYTDIAEALKEAYTESKNYSILEYGICEISIPREF